MQGDSDDKAGERLRELALELARLIRGTPGAFIESARWLQARPLAPLKEDEVYAQAWGPTSRRLIEGWGWAFRSFPPGTDRFIDFGLQEATRVALLAALTAAKDFDGSEVGLGWSWGRPADSTAEFDGRSWAWSNVTGGPYGNVMVLELAEEASRFLRLNLSTSSASGAAAGLDAADPRPTASARNFAPSGEDWAAVMKQRESGWPQCAKALKLVTQRIRARPTSFAAGGQLLDRLFSVEQVRRDRAAFVRQHVRPRRDEFRALGQRMEPTPWRHGSPQPKRLRLWLAMLWALKRPLSMTLDEAEAVLIVAWLGYDDQASTFSPVLCSLQEDPWAYRRGAVEAFAIKDDTGDVGRVQPAFGWSELVEQVELATSKVDAVSRKAPEADAPDPSATAQDRTAAVQDERTERPPEKKPRPSGRQKKRGPKRRFNEEEDRRLVAQHENSGMTREEFERKHNLDPGAVTKAFDRVRNKRKPSRRQGP